MGTALARLCPPYDCAMCRNVARNNENKNGRDFSRPFCVCVCRYRGGAVPGGGGGSEA
ncbi:hypothetical protein BDS110ZK14_64530 [Bradyrhizobium diazoefficiens]